MPFKGILTFSIEIFFLCESLGMAKFEEYVTFIGAKVPSVIGKSVEVFHKISYKLSEDSKV